MGEEVGLEAGSLVGGVENEAGGAEILLDVADHFDVKACFVGQVRGGRPDDGCVWIGFEMKAGEDAEGVVAECAGAENVEERPINRLESVPWLHLLL